MPLRPVNDPVGHAPGLAAAGLQSIPTTAGGDGSPEEASCLIKSSSRRGYWMLFIQSSQTGPAVSNEASVRMSTSYNALIGRYRHINGVCGRKEQSQAK